MIPKLGNIWWLVSYPKSGNTWVRMFLTVYLTEKPVNINAKKQFVISDIDPKIHPKYKTKDEYLEYYTGSISRLHNVCLKTHHANIKINGRNLIPWNITNGGVYLVRDPRDVVISLASHYTIKFDKAIEFLNNRESVIGNKNDVYCHVLTDWSSHVESWQRTGMLIVKYEDLSVYTLEVFKSIVKAFFIPIYDDERFSFAINQTSFERLSKQENENGFVECKGKDKFFRVGKSGQWYKILSKKQIKKIESKHHILMERFGYL